MIIAHTSDWHIEEGPRLEESARMHDIFIDECRRAKVDATFDTGDQWHPHKSGIPATPTELVVAVDYHRRRIERAPEVGVLGNHDIPANIDLFNRLEGQNPIWFALRPHKYTFREFDCLCLPWFWKSHIAASLPAGIDGEELSRRTNAIAQQYLITMRAEADLTRSQGRIPIGLGHLMVVGSELSSGQNQSVMGTTVALTPWDLKETNCAVFLLGHVHRTQQWFDGTVGYAGSPMRFDLGEPETKGFRLIEVEKDGDGYRVRNDFVELPARRIELLEVDFTDPDQLAKLQAQGANNVVAEILDASQASGALARLRYRIDPEYLHLIPSDDVEKLMLSKGAFTAKAEPVMQHEARVRSEAITVATDTWGKVRAFWDAKKIDVPAETREDVRTKLTDLEQGKSVAVEVAA